MWAQSTLPCTVAAPAIHCDGLLDILLSLRQNIYNLIHILRGFTDFNIPKMSGLRVSKLGIHGPLRTLSTLGFDGYVLLGTRQPLGCPCEGKYAWYVVV